MVKLVFTLFQTNNCSQTKWKLLKYIIETCFDTIMVELTNGSKQRFSKFKNLKIVL